MIGQLAFVILICHPRNTVYTLTLVSMIMRGVGGVSVLLSFISSVVQTPNTGHAG